jgi:hypothetical protein
MTHAGTSSTAGVARDFAMTEKSCRGPSEMNPIGSPARYATRPAEFFRRRASLASTARRRSSVPPALWAIPSARCCAAV